MGRALMVAAAAGLAALAAVSNGWAAGQSYTVTGYTGYYGPSWSPSDLRIEPTDSVTWASADGVHTVVSETAGLADCAALPCTQTFGDEGVFTYHCGVHPATMRGTLRVLQPITVTITSPAAGESVQGTITVTGTASHPTTPIDRVNVRIDAQIPRTATLSGSGTSVGWTLDLSTTTTANGPHLLIATAVAAGGRVGTASVAVTFANPPTVDLQATSISALKTGSTTAPTATLTLVVSNVGNTAAGPFTVLFEYEHKGTWRPIATASSNGLGAFSATSFTTVWDPEHLLVGRFPVRGTADAGGTVPEVSESNNSATGAASFYTDAVAGVDAQDP